MVKQKKYDSNYVLTSIAFARRLFERQGYVTAIELKIKDGVDIGHAKKKIQAIVGDGFKVLDRYEQHFQWCSVG